MSYSNGYDLAVILPALRGRVGWQSDTAVRKFESFHALCTENNLKDIQPTENISTSAFTTYKTELTDQIIQRCLSSVFSEGEYLEQVLLHKRIPGTVNEAISNTGIFCGIRIMVVPSFDVSVWVKSVTLFFNQAKTFNLYLYQDGQEEPVDTIEVTTDANIPTTLDIEDLVLSYAATGCNVFYLGYFQDDLDGAQAIREQVCYSKANHFSAVSINAPKLTATTFDQTAISYGYDTVGINAEVHALKDYTYKIKNAPHLFDEVIGLSMVYFLLEQIVSSTRSNATERVLKGAYEAIELKHYLYGSVPAMGVAKTTGLNEVLAQKFETIRNKFNPKTKAVTVSIC